MQRGNHGVQDVLASQIMIVGLGSLISVLFCDSITITKRCKGSGLEMETRQLTF